MVFEILGLNLGSVISLAELFKECLVISLMIMIITIIDLPHSAIMENNETMCEKNITDRLIITIINLKP